MVSKKILGVAIAAALSAQAFAVDFPLVGSNATGNATASLKVAKSSLITTGKVTASSVDYFVITKDTGLDLDVTGSVGIGLAADQKLYVRVQLSNAVFKTAVTAGSLVLTDSGAGATTDTLSQGGQSGDNYAVFTVSPTATEKFETTDTFTLTLADLAVSGAAGAGVSVTFHNDIIGATGNTNALFTANNKGTPVVTFVDGIEVATTAGTNTADVNFVFKQFTGASLSTSKGLVSTLTYTPVASVAAAAGTALNVNLTEVANTTTSKVKVTGDFSAGIWWLDTANNCATVPANQAASNLTLNAGKTEAEGTLAAALTNKYLCVSVPTGVNAVTIPAADYTLSTTLAAVTNAAAGAHTALSNKEAGKIDRDGTTVLVPFLTLNPGFNQKIFIVNRGTTAAALTVNGLVADAGATGFALTTAGAAGTTLAAGKQTELVVSQWFQVDPAATTKRGAATLNIAAPSSKVDVLIQTTNAEGAQNTVILQNDGKKFGGN